ncbi:MAG: sulfotransferase [Bacteroidales bacterium]|nr:sulfotransferase [Bacteroidales bacterium]
MSDTKQIQKENQIKDIGAIPVFFILSRPRTGSTLLRTLFDAHPNIQIPPECQFIVNLHPKYGKRNYWNHDNILEFVDDLEKQFLFDSWKLDIEKLKDSLTRLAGPLDYATLCKAVYLHYQSLFAKGKIFWIGDKNPGYALYIEQLRSIFPDAKFIHLTRDYRDNYHSLARVEFELPIISLTTYKWKYFYRKITSAAEQLSDDFTTIRYEDLVKQPETEMKRLCQFLGIDYDPGILRFHEKRDEFLKIYPEAMVNRIHASLMHPVSDNKTGIWRTKLSEREIRIADYVVGTYGQMAGYDKQFAGKEVDVKLAAMPGILLARSIYLATRIVNRLPYKRRQYILSELPFVLGRFWKQYLAKPSAKNGAGNGNASHPIQ